MASTAPRGSMDEGTRRFFGVVVVAMLLLVVIVSALMTLPTPGRNGYEDEDRGWEVRDDTIVVYDDATWSGWDAVLEHPVEIEFGRTLTVVDSHLEIPLERMVLEEVPPFNVSSSASLVLEDTTIQVDSDPQLENAVFDGNWWGSSTPMMWRVVNLLDAEEPVLEMEVELLRGEPYVVVAAQRTPGDDLEPWGVIEPGDMELLEWTTVRVPLEGLAGGAPRLVLFVHDGTYADVVISNLRILDGDGPLPYDVYEVTGSDEEEWEMEHFDSFIDDVGYGWSINPLIIGEGSLKATGSRILSLPGLSRSGVTYYPQTTTVDGWNTHVSLSAASDVSGIIVTGDIVMSSTEVAYVPLETLGVYASFDDCSFVGDAELLTISKAEAYVRDCDFEFRVEEGLWGEGRIHHDTWMLSLERTIRDPLVERCTFKGEGNGTGLVVNHQRADLIELEFSGLRVGAWVHGVGPSMGWDVLEPSLSFDGTCSVKYMETVEVRVEFDGDDDPGYGYEGYRTQYSRSISGVPDVGGLSFPVISSANSSLCCLPLRIVSEENGSFEVEELTIRLRPPWGNWDDYTVDPREPWLLFWLEGEGGGSWDGAFYMYREVLDPGKDPGVLNVTYTIHNYLYDIGEIYVNTTVDGEQVDHFVLNNTEYGWWYYNTALLNCTLTIPPGIHEYNVTCGLVSTTWDLTTELESHEGAIYRVSDPSQTGDLEDWLVDNPRATVLVDPYIAIDGLEVVGTEPILALEIRFVAWEGSSVVFDRVELDPGSWGELVTVGGGMYEFGDISAELLVHTARNCTVTIGHMDSYYFGATYSGCNVTIADHWNCSILSIECRDGSRIETEGLVTNSLELTLSEADCYLRGCEFRGAVWSGTLISARENSTLCVDGCEFINVPLMVPLYDSHASISVTNCTFRGEGAYFSLGCHHTLMSYSHLSNITPISGDVSGNVFDGEGTSLVFLPLLRGCLLGENTWRDGARAYAFYDPEVEYDGFSYRKYGFITADSISFYRSIGSDWRTINLDFYHLVDVTEDPLSDEDPGLVPSVIRVVPHYYYRDPSGPVVGYQALPVAASTITLRNLEWPDPEDGVAEIQRTFAIDDNWWKR